jgi:hypothetical protein
MNLKSFAGGMLVAVFLIGALGQIGVSADRMSANDTLSIPAETVAGYVHAIIQADRATYTTQIVDRMQLRGITVASENWEQRGTLPLPVQFLRESSRLVAENQKGVSFKLISLWPINQRNAPTNEFERTGLQEVLAQVDRPYTGIVTKGGSRYYQAVFADRAISQGCVGCHNAHAESPKRNFKLNDVMGGVLVTFPLPQ